MRLLYLGEMLMDSRFIDCLTNSNRYERIDHLTKPTLDYTHISMNPQPDVIIIKCDWQGHEIEWAHRYSPEIPKLFLVCQDCKEKQEQYHELGDIYDIDLAIKQGDFGFTSLLNALIKYESASQDDNYEP